MSSLLLVPSNTTQLSREEKRQKLSELFSEASALEKQLKDFQTQQNLLFRDNKASARTAEQHAALDEEVAFLRDSLKDIYEEIILGDLHLATTSNAEERLWRNVFHAYIEDARVRLRRLSPVPRGDAHLREPHDRLRFELNRHLDIGFGFYHDLINALKNQFGINMNIVGVELFKSSANPHHPISPSSSPSVSSLVLKELAASTIQRCLIYLGDLARYRVVHVQDAAQADGADAETSAASNGNGGPGGGDDPARWDMARGFYLKAIEVWRDQGKPYSQLALLAIPNSSPIDVVYYYSMSLAMKHPSTVGRDNLRSFYTKTKFPEDDAIIAGKAKEDGNERVRKALEQFGYAFLRVHKGLVFGEVREQQQSRNSAVPPATTADATTSVTVALSVLVESVLGAPSPPDPDAVGASIAKDLLRMTITKAIAILIATVWDLGERAKDTKAPTATRHHLRTSQSQTITLAFDLLAPFDLPAPTAPAAASNRILLQPLSIWCSFLAHNHDLLAQIYALARRSEPAVEPRHSSAYTSGRGREVEADAARDVLTRLMALMRGLAARFGEEARAHSGSTPVVDERIAMWPVPEDGELLGMMPLRKFHAGIDLLREADERDGEEGAGDERRVRVARVWMCLKRFAELETFDFIQYNEAENKFIVIDEETKKQQRTRMMRVLATQRLKEQVTSLEQDLSQLAVSPPTSPNRRDRRTSVVLSSGATLPKRQRRESKNRHGGPTIPLRIVTVVVDVSVLMDALPLVKRWAGIGGGLDAAVGGGGVLCEVIVPLDVIDSLDFHKKGMTTTNVHAREAIRFLDQRFRPHNDHANSAPASLNHDGQPASSLAIVGLVSSFLRAQRVSERLEKWEDVAPLWVGPLSYRADKDEGDAAEAVENEEAQPTEMDVPKRFRPVIGCALHYYQNQRRAGVAAAVGTGAGGVQQKAVDVVLVTNDKAMAWWAGMFGAGRGGLEVLGPEEWDRRFSGKI